MHIQVDTIKFREILDVVSRISTKHSTLPVLQCVLLEAKKGILTVRATNLEIGIQGTLSIDMEEEGVIAVPATLLLHTINLTTQSKTTLSTEGDTLIIDGKFSKTEIKSISAQDFPVIPQVSGKPITLQSQLFTLGIKTAAFTASQSSIKPELGSVYIHQKREHTLTFVATDSFRLMEKTITQKGVSLTDPILIPYKNALELAHVAEGTEGTIELTMSENQCALTVGNIYITSRLVHGTFPDYEQIIPKEYKTTITLLTNDLTQALKKTSIFLNKFMQLTLIATKGSLTLQAQSGDTGSTTETVHASVDGEDITLNFNQRYIHEVVPHVTDDSVRIKCAGVGRPMVVENLHDTSLRYLVMPMNK